jgi:hypothetical protein
VTVGVTAGIALVSLAELVLAIAIRRLRAS